VGDKKFFGCFGKADMTRSSLKGPDSIQWWKFSHALILTKLKNSCFSVSFSGKQHLQQACVLKARDVLE
jgi:hypothetical protein